MGSRIIEQMTQDFFVTAAPNRSSAATDYCGGYTATCWRAFRRGWLDIPDTHIRALTMQAEQ